MRVGVKNRLCIHKLGRLEIVKICFETAQSLGFKGVNVSISERVEKAHHCIENRKVYTVPVSKLPALHEQNQWVGLTTVVMVVRSIQHWNKTTDEVQKLFPLLESTCQ